MNFISCVNCILNDLPATALGDNATYALLTDGTPIIFRYSGSKNERPSIIYNSEQAELNTEISY